jgi:hypothetical protein
MSLTSELKIPNSFVRAFIEREFPHLKEQSRNINRLLQRFSGMEYAKYPDR